MYNMHNTAEFIQLACELMLYAGLAGVALLALVTLRGK